MAVALASALGLDPDRLALAARVHDVGMLAVPIVLFSAERYHFAADKLQGVIAVQTNGPRDFSDDEVNFVETVAGELAIQPDPSAGAAARASLGLYAFAGRGHPAL